MNTAEILSLRKGDVVKDVLWVPCGEYTVSHKSPLGVWFEGLSAGVSNNALIHATVVRKAGYVEPKKLSLMEKLVGCTFKFGLLKNTRGAKNQNFIDKFSGSEFVFQSFSGAYVYGYPVGHFGDPDYRCQFDASAVRFFHEDQDSVDSVPDITLLKKIKHTADL